MNASTAVRDCAPTNSATTCPFRNAFTAGMPRMPNSSASFGLASTSTLANRTARSEVAASSTGVSALQGPHQSAQKSTITGCSAEAAITSAAKVSSLTSISTASNARGRVQLPALLRGALLGDRFEAAADLVDIGAEIVEARQRGERLDAEDALEERRRAVADRAELVVAAALGDQAALDQP